MASPGGIICSDQDYKRSLQDRSITCLTRSDTIGVLLTVEAGFVSLLAILYVFGVIGRNIFWRIKHMPTARLRVFHQPMDLLMFSLLLADVVQATGVLLSLRWLAGGKVEVGDFCNVQGITKILGATAVACSTAGITIFTFIAVWMQKPVSSMKATLFVVFGIWTFAVFIVILGVSANHDPSNPAFLSPTPYWCWVNHHYGVGWRLVSEYVWMWIALLLSVLVYIPLYLWMRGNIEVDAQAWWRARFKWKPERDQQIIATRRRSLTMLAYPIVYSLSIMPLSIVRWMVYVQEVENGASHIPSAATFTAVSIFGLSGFFNAILLVTTRRRSGLFGELMFTAPSRQPICFRNEREARYSQGRVGGQSKTTTILYDDEIFHIAQV